MGSSIVPQSWGPIQHLPPILRGPRYITGAAFFFRSVLRGAFVAHFSGLPDSFAVSCFGAAWRPCAGGSASDTAGHASAHAASAPRSLIFFTFASPFRDGCVHEVHIH